ncbi:hypothetical protein [Castellaniella sp.]|uniref:hypothetical protein n=1 Tax=Castellaniella sp. TaxID=1955812 RepID=UPI003A8F6961
MHIVIPGAWPEPEVAGELAGHVAQRAPALAAWMAHSTTAITQSPAADTWCMPHEHWLLKACNFNPAEAEHISAGLGPLRGAPADKEPVWLAELVHMAPSRDGAALLPARVLDITPEQSHALWETAKDYLQESGLELEALTTDTWRVRWPQAVTLPCASPALVATSAVNDWWPQEAVARPWRQLANTLQMAWYEHPANQARAALGQAPVNSLWLYGGAGQSQLGRTPPNDIQTDFSLYDLAISQQWGEWIEALARLDQQLFTQLTTQPASLILSGRNRYVELSAHTGWFARWRTQDWRRWWCSR